MLVLAGALDFAGAELLAVLVFVAGFAVVLAALDLAAAGAVDLFALAVFLGAALAEVLLLAAVDLVVVAFALDVVFFVSAIINSFINFANIILFSQKNVKSFCKKTFSSAYFVKFYADVEWENNVFCF